MKSTFKKLLVCLLILTLVFSILPVSALASERSGKVQLTPSDKIWKEIESLKAKRGIADSDSAKISDYAAILDEVADLVMSSKEYRKGSIERNADAVAWYTEDGVYNFYSASLEMEVQRWSKEDPDQGAVLTTIPGFEEGSMSDPLADSEELTATTTTSGKNIRVFQPFRGFSGGNIYDIYDDYDLDTLCNEAAKKTGGTFKRFNGTEATITRIANAIENSAVVYLDSHGYCGADFTGSVRSYLCLKTGSGITSTDYAQKHAFLSGSTYYVDGTAITNHMTNKAPNNLVHLGCCSGMKKNTLCKPLQNKGVGVVLGFDNRVSSWYETYCFKVLMEKLTDEDDTRTVSEAVAEFKSSEPYEELDGQKVYLIVVSAEDTWTTGKQTVNTPWSLLPSSLKLSLTNPGDVQEGCMSDPFKGTATSNYDIKKVKATLYAVRDDQELEIATDTTTYSYGKTYKLQNKQLGKFLRDEINKLSCSEYWRFKVKVTVTDSSGKSVTKSVIFSVIERSHIEVSIRSRFEVPVGHLGSVSGQVSSNYDVTRIRVEIKNCATGKQIGAFNVSPSGRLVDLNDWIGGQVRSIINNQSAGTYYMWIKAWNSLDSTATTESYIVLIKQ